MAETHAAEIFADVVTTALRAWSANLSNTTTTHPRNLCRQWAASGAAIGR